MKDIMMSRTPEALVVGAGQDRDRFRLQMLLSTPNLTFTDHTEMTQPRLLPCLPILHRCLHPI